MFMLSKFKDFLDKKISYLKTHVNFKLWLNWLNQWNYFDISFKIDSLSHVFDTEDRIETSYVDDTNSQLLFFPFKEKINYLPSTAGWKYRCQYKCSQKLGVKIVHGWIHLGLV